MKRNLLDKILFYLSVPKCVGCGGILDIDDFGLCKECETVFAQKTVRNCSRCSKTLNSCRCAPKLLRDNRVRSLSKCYRYIINEENRVLNNLLFSLKKDNRKDVLLRMSYLLADSIRNLTDDLSELLITNVPRRKQSIKKYGIDHSALLAKTTAKILGLKYASTLKSKAQRQQKNLNREERIENANFEVKKSAFVNGRKIILIDDIVTTGASMAKSANVLRKSGAKKVYGACIAIAYRDEYTPPMKSYTSFI